jgi:hypothetical protein
MRVIFPKFLNVYKFIFRLNGAYALGIVHFGELSYYTLFLRGFQLYIFPDYLCMKALVFFYQMKVLVFLLRNQQRYY